MDRLNLGHGVSTRPSASLPMPFHSASKAAPHRKLSRPRLVKHRKHSNFQERSVISMHDNGGGLGFNPFQPEIPIVVLDRQDRSGADSVQDQVASHAYGYSSSGSGFVFGASSSMLNPDSSKTGVPSNESIEFSTRGKGAQLYSGAGSLSDSNTTSAETRMPVGDFVHSSSTEDVFVSGSSACKAVNLRYHSSLECDDPSSKLNLYTSVDGSDGNMNSNIFLFKNEEEQCAHSRKNKNSFSDDFVFKKRPDNCNEADLGNSGKDYSEKEDLGSHTFHRFAKTNDNSFSKLPEELGKLRLKSSGNDEHVSTDPRVIWVGDGVKKSTNLGISMPFGSVDGSFSNLDEKMKKHNFWNSADEGQKDAEFTIFACDSSVKEDAQLSQSCSLGFDEGIFSKLHRERKVLQSSCKDNENDSDSTKSSSSHILDSNGSTFEFSGNKDTTTTSIHRVDHELQKKIGELEVDSSLASRDRSNATADFKSVSSVFESGANFTVSSSQISEMSSTIPCKGIPLKFQNERTFGAESFSSKVSLDKTNNSVLLQEKVIGGVLFESSNNLSYSVGDSFVHIENTDSKMGVSTNGVDLSSPPASLVTGTSGSFDTTLQSEKHNHGARVVGFCADESVDTENKFFSSPTQGFHSSEAKFNFTSMHEGLEPIMECRSQKQNTSLTKESFYKEPCKQMTFTVKKVDSKCLLKKRRGKCRQSTQVHSGAANKFHLVDKDLKLNLEYDATDNNSPMDYSPFQETLVSKPCTKEASVSSDVPNHFDSSYTPYGKEQELVSPAEYFDANDCLPENEAVFHGSRTPSMRNYACESYLAREMNSELGKGCLATEDGNVGPRIETCTLVQESESFGFGLSTKLHSTSCGEDTVNNSNFVFSARSLGQNQLIAQRRGYRKKSRVKGGEDTHPNTEIPLPLPGKVDKAKANQELALEEACEKWRLRGNKAYRDGDFYKAEDCYSRGVNAFSIEEASENCSSALMLCYSNRAATRMSLGRPRAALDDCKIAIAIDPTFFRAHVRAGNIHLSLGDPAAARQHFNKCLELDRNSTTDSKVSSEVADGLEKAQKLSSLLDQSSVFVAKRTLCDAAKCLKIISEALSISPYSESLLEMKAEALLMLQDYEGAIQICEQTLELAEKNAVVTESDCLPNDSNHSKSTARSDVRLWRWHVISRSYFHLGKLEEACELIQKHERVKPVIDKYGNTSVESYTSFPVTVRELLRLKAAGNKAFQAGRHLEAVEHYTAAVILSIESRPFAAICFCNRAAAYQAMGKIVDAIADCSFAIALDPSYKKAISRRATLLEMIRDYGQSASDLRKLVSLLQNSSDDKNASGAEGIAISSTSDLNQARTRLSILENEARKCSQLDLYMILGIDKSSSALDVRKAYRRAALKHHPDKACQFLAHCENGDYGVWREIADDVYANADRLFKMIAEAQAILIDSSKRLQYDAEEESRIMKNGHGESSPTTTPSSNNSYQRERNADRFRSFSYRGRR
ncbi:hypothetical protein HPP92_024998 [Vanilla planifolia]|uniref:J domain-containing protein n=1 Tax=Vanilla planifolia TaxID=51239 RepID=A0A835U7C1_VANPL|nr:hypothetical protein HPP92_024998 [Vanilla planifolia]